MQPATYPVRWLVVALAAILVIAFYPYIFGGKTFLPTDMFDTMTALFNAEYGPPQAQNHYSYDGIAQTYPYKFQSQRALANGHLAFWNPHILGGFPQYAATGGNNFDPFNILLLWFSVEHAITAETVLELWLAGIGMLLLLRFLGISSIANILFSSAYMLNSMFISTASIRWAIASFCWIPFAVFQLLQHLNTGQRTNFYISSIFLALSFLCGNLQSSFYLLIILAIIVLFYPSPTTKFQRVQKLIFLSGLAGLLSAIMWLPTIELFIQVLFNGGHLNSTSVYATYSVVQRLLTIPMLAIFAFPELFGGPQVFSPRIIAGLDVTNFHGGVSFIVAVFAIAGSFFLWTERKLRPFIILLFCGILLPVATPLFSLLYHRFFIVVSFAMCIVGAVFCEQWFDRIAAERKRNILKAVWWALAGLSVLLLIACIITTVEGRRLTDILSKHLAATILGSSFGIGNESWMLGRISKTLNYYSFSNPYLWLPILGSFAALIVLQLNKSLRLSKQNTLILLVILTVFQLTLFTRLWLPSIPTTTFPFFPNDKIESFLESNLDHQRFTTWRDTSKETNIFPSNSSTVYGVDELSGYESLTCRSGGLFYHQHISTNSIDPRLLGLWSVKYILAGAHALPASSTTPVFHSDNITIYENKLCKPRAYFPSGYQSVSTDKEAADSLLSPSFDGSRVLFIKNDLPSLTQSIGDGTVAFESYCDNEIILHTTASQSRILVLTDTYYPGWKCYINNLPTHIYRSNYCQRAVVIPTGAAQIIFRFEPWSFRLGCWISGTVIIVLLILLVLDRKRSTANTALPTTSG